MLLDEMERSRDKSTADIKRALLRMINRAQAEESLLDHEDQETLVRYGMGEITKAELDRFARRKAACLRLKQ